MSSFAYLFYKLFINQFQKLFSRLFVQYQADWLKLDDILIVSSRNCRALCQGQELDFLSNLRGELCIEIKLLINLEIDKAIQFEQTQKIENNIKFRKELQMRKSSILCQSKQNLPPGKKIEESETVSVNASKQSKRGIHLLKQYLLKKTENMYKLNLSDEEAFKWKFKKDKNNRPLSSFRLIKKQDTVKPQITSEDLRNYNFPVLAHKNKDLVGFAITILKQNEYFKANHSKDESGLKKLVNQLSLNYNIVSYHNFSHAFSLTLMLYQCFEYHPQLNKYFSPEDKFFAMIAGLAHDLNHPGTNNAFEVKTNSQRAIEFGNESVLENFHIKQFWKLIKNHPEITFFNNERAQANRKHVTYLILMTDVAQHFKNLEDFKRIRAEVDAKDEYFMEKPQNKEFFLGQLFHACDIGNPCIGFDNYITWAALLSHEFNQQTVLEKENQVDITQMLRYKDLKTFYKGQIGFINYLVVPIWKEISSICSNLKVFTDNIDANIKTLNNKIDFSTEEDEFVEIEL